MKKEHLSVVVKHGYIIKKIVNLPKNPTAGEIEAATNLSKTPCQKIEEFLPLLTPEISKRSVKSLVKKKFGFPEKTPSYEFFVALGKAYIDSLPKLSEEVSDLLTVELTEEEVIEEVSDLSVGELTEEKVIEEVDENFNLSPIFTMIKRINPEITSIKIDFK